MPTYGCVLESVGQGDGAAANPGSSNDEDDEPQFVGELNFEEALEVRS